MLHPVRAAALSILSSPLCPDIRPSRHQLMPHSLPSSLHWTTSLHTTTTTSHPLPALPLCPPPSSAGPHSSPASSSRSPSLSSPCLTSSSQDPRGGLVGGGGLCWTSYFRFTRCTAGRSLAELARFLSHPLAQCFVFSFPLHIVCLMCSDVQLFLRRWMRVQ